MTQPIDPQLFRRALGHFAAGVTVVTALDAAGQARGMTATAFSSLSLNPPLVLVCVDKGATFYEVITAASHFAINFLSDQQQHLSQRFASRSEDKFAGVAQAPGQTGAPLLADTLAAIECARYDVLPGGDHVIVLGQVEHLVVNGGAPLTHFAGKYRFLQPLANLDEK
jgi:flavin reductase (DIM6/NTAB) family NADH-FMN oxidoreductase RutF